MPPKASGKKGDKKKKADTVPDESLPKFIKAYKKLSAEVGMPMLPAIDKRLAQIAEEGDGQISEINLAEDVGPMQIRILSDALKEVSYSHTQSVRLWKCDAGDEGVRALCNYIGSNQSVRTLQIMDSRLTSLGCEFIGDALRPKMNMSIAFLRLDHNDIGAEGVRNLAIGLCQNESLRVLSLAYCNIGPEGGRPLQEILIFWQSKLKELNLQGNYLGPAGVMDVLHGCKRAKSLSSLVLTDNKFGEEPEVLESLLHVVATKPTITSYDLRFNAIGDEGAKVLLEGLQGKSHVQQFKLTERISKEIFEQIVETVKKNKPGKKGRKGGKKKKK